MDDLRTKYPLPKEILIALDELEALEKNCHDANMRLVALNKEMWIRDRIDMFNMVEEAKETMIEAEKIINEAEKLINEADEIISEIQSAEEHGSKEGIINAAKKCKELRLKYNVIKEATGLDIETIKKL